MEYDSDLWSTCENDDYGFFFVFPRGWQQVPHPQYMVLRAADARSFMAVENGAAKRIFSPALTLVLGARAGGPSAGKTARQVLDGVGNDLPRRFMDYEPVKTTEHWLKSGQPGRLFEFHCTYGQHRMHAVMLVAVTARSVFTFDAMACDQDWARHSTGVLTSLHSLTSTDETAPCDRASRRSAPILPPGSPPSFSPPREETPWPQIRTHRGPAVGGRSFQRAPQPGLWHRIFGSRRRKLKPSDPPPPMDWLKSPLLDASPPASPLGKQVDATNVACCHCQKPVLFDAQLAGQWVACPHCGGEFAMPGSHAPARLSPPSGEDVAADGYFPTTAGKVWCYEIEVFSVDGPLCYEEVTWPTGDGKSLKSTTRSMLTSPLGASSDALRLRLDVAVTGFAAQQGPLRYPRGVELEVLHDDLKVFRGCTQLFWAISPSPQFSVLRVALYSAKSPGAPNPATFGVSSIEDGSSQRHFFHLDKPGTSIGFSDSPESLLFVGATNDEGRALGPCLHFIRRVNQAKPRPDGKVVHIDREFTEDMWFAQGKGLVRLEQRVAGELSMIWKLL